MEIARAAGDESTVAMFVAAVIGGAFFGDNLSFISDTTIASTRTQGCSMSDKFKANIRIVVPAAIITLCVYVVIGREASGILVPDAPNAWLTIPYLLILATAIAGVNVVVVLMLGILAALVTGVAAGTAGLTAICVAMGEGIDSMGNLIVVTLMAAGLVGVVKTLGGIDFLIDRLSRRVTGRRGAQASIALLAGSVDVCTANNTVAILTVGTISSTIARRFGVDPRKSASLLDTASCIAQCLIPLRRPDPYGHLAGRPHTRRAMALPLLSLGSDLVTALSIIFLFPRRLRGSHPSAV